MQPGHSLLLFLLRCRAAVTVSWSLTLVPLAKSHPTTLPGRMSSALEEEEVN